MKYDKDALKPKKNISGYCEGDLHFNCHVSWCDCECHIKKCKHDNPHGCLECMSEIILPDKTEVS